MARTEEEIRERIEMAVTEEMNTVNIITQGEPERWVPLFVKFLTDKVHDICMDEIRYRKRI